jgi:DNA-binding NtrC family response regulator
MSRGFEGIEPAAARMLESYSWPGNVRELKNVMEKICIMHRGPLLLPEYLPAEIAGGTAAALPGSTDLGALLAAGLSLDEAVTAFERQLVRSALQQCGGNVLQAAALLKIPRGTLRYKVEKLGL